MSEKTVGLGFIGFGPDSRDLGQRGLRPPLPPTPRWSLPKCIARDAGAIHHLIDPVIRLYTEWPYLVLLLNFD
jgi:hypothetical protein